jgi:hypothetical protein
LFVVSPSHAKPCLTLLPAFLANLFEYIRAKRAKIAEKVHLLFITIPAGLVESDTSMLVVII